MCGCGLLRGMDPRYSFTTRKLTSADIASRELANLMFRVCGRPVVELCALQALGRRKSLSEILLAGAVDDEPFG